MQLVPHKKFGQNWPTHESLHKIHLGRAFQPISHHFYGICCYLKLADTIAPYKNRNLKPKNRIGRLKNRNSNRTDTIGRFKNRNLRPRNRIGRLKNRNSKRTDTIGRFKNRNLTSTDCIVRYNRKIESVSEYRSIGPFAHLWLSSGDNVVIWDEMLSSGANVIIWDEMLSSGMKCYHLG